MLKDIVKRSLSEKHLLLLRKNIESIRAIGKGYDLARLGAIYHTDKATGHHYMPHYQLHFSPLKYEKINLLEIGVGGYEKPMAGARSLRMWKKYFPFGSIYSIDIYDKSAL